ncbi:MAG: GNAT family acetyltransferase, partial [Patescibacteria group bacterium]
GLKNVLVTCDVTNLGSAKIIEENGGRLENQVEQGGGMPAKARYWIEIK